MVAQLLSLSHVFVFEKCGSLVAYAAHCQHSLGLPLSMVATWDIYLTEPQLDDWHGIKYLVPLGRWHRIYEHGQDLPNDRCDGRCWPEQSRLSFSSLETGSCERGLTWKLGSISIERAIRSRNCLTELHPAERLYIRSASIL